MDPMPRSLKVASPTPSGTETRPLYLTRFRVAHGGTLEVFLRKILKEPTFGRKEEQSLTVSPAGSVRPFTPRISNKVTISNNWCGRNSFLVDVSRTEWVS